MKKRWVLTKEYFKKDELAKHGSIMFIASIITGILNYFYQVYMGRILGPEEYSIFGALFAIFYMIGVISQTLSTSVTRFTSKFIGEKRQIGFFIKGFTIQMVLLGIISSIIFFILRYRLMSALKLSDTGPILVLIFILFLTCVTPMACGVLRGVKRFSALGFVNISNAFCKLIFGVFFVILGLGVSGALFGVAIGAIFSLVISFIFMKPYIKLDNPRDPEFKFKNFYFYSFPVLIAMIGYSIPSNLDVILAKYFFNSLDAGMYASVSVLGKIVFFFPSAIGTVIFPMVTERYVKGEDGIDILKKGIIYTAILSGFLVTVYVSFPDIITKIFGNKYADAIPLVAPYGIAMLFFSLISIIVNYHLAIKNMRYIIIFAIFIGVEILAMLIFHSSLLEMTNVLMIGNILFLIVSMIYTFRGVIIAICNIYIPTVVKIFKT